MTRKGVQLLMPVVMGMEYDTLFPVIQILHVLLIYKNNEVTLILNIKCHSQALSNKMCS